MINHIGKISLVLIVMVTLYTFYTTKMDIEKRVAQSTTFIDEDNRLHVLGLILPKNTLREAEIKLKSRADTALYLYPGKEGGRGTVTLEAFFPSIADHSKVILGLKADQQLLDDMQKRAMLPRLYPNGVARMNLGTEDVLAVLNFPITSITLIPSLDIDEKMLEARFGKAKEITKEDKGIIRYWYPNVSLKAFVDPNGKDKLNFSMPETAE
jgi:hypothetical protein